MQHACCVQRCVCGDGDDVMHACKLKRCIERVVSWISGSKKACVHAGDRQLHVRDTSSDKGWLATVLVLVAID
jgi:hypothetical protein